MASPEDPLATNWEATMRDRFDGTPDFVPFSIIELGVKELGAQDCPRSAAILAAANEEAYANISYEAAAQTYRQEQNEIADKAQTYARENPQLLDRISRRQLWLVANQLESRIIIESIQNDLQDLYQQAAPFRDLLVQLKRKELIEQRNRHLSPLYLETRKSMREHETKHIQALAMGRELICLPEDTTPGF
jgi:hypothetical protein